MTHKIPRISLANFGALVIFGVAFGFVEAAVVYYLRDIFNLHVNYAVGSYHMLLNLGFIAFIRPVHYMFTGRIGSIEVAREASTIIMLAAVGWLSAKSRRQRWGAFLISFACWDIFYYVFLKILTGWPGSWDTKDIYFLIPVVWVGPVITPLISSLIILCLGGWLYLRQPEHSK